MLLSTCSFNFLSAYCVRFCLNLFVDKNDSDKTIHNLQLASAWIRRLKTRGENYILFFRYFIQ